MADGNTERFSLRLGDPDRWLADALAHHYGLPDRSSLIRHLLRRDARAQGIEPPTPPADRKRGRPKNVKES